MARYIGKGTVYAGQVSAGVLQGALRALGNISVLDLAVETDRKELVDYQNAGGGFSDTLERVTGVTASLTMHEFDAENIALALRGATSAVTAGTVTDESITAKVGGLVETANLIDTTQTVTVTSDPAGTTYTAGTDYTVTKAGIVIPTGSTIADDAALLISYTKEATDVVQALVNSGLEYRLVFDGLNEVNSGKGVRIRAHRFKFNPTGGLSVIGDEFGAMELSGDILKDETITTPGLSQYVKIELEQ